MKSVKCLVALAISASLVVATPAAARAQQDTYSDVIDGVHKPAIDILAEMGLFDGTLCGDDGFCPSEPIERSTMAVWLVRSLQDGEPAPTGATRFADVDPDQWWAPHAERLAELEITVGCQQDPLHFCPDDLIHRDRMATLLVRAFDLEPAPPSAFADIEGSTRAPDIDSLAAAGITAGCKQNPLRYCPTSPVTRAQMATFLGRALGLVDAPQPILSPATYRAVTAGGDHSCAIRNDGTVTCWGYNSAGQAEAPEGRFKAVAAGSGHTCGLRADDTIECWGHNEDGQADAPGGTFESVAANYDHSFGLRSDDTVTCWGQHEEPGGSLKAIVARFGGGCRLRADDTLECGASSSDPPEGTFKAVSAGSYHTCGLRTDDTIECWGNNERGQASPPGGRFIDIDGNCGVRSDLVIVCWGYRTFRTADPVGASSRTEPG